MQDFNGQVPQINDRYKKLEDTIQTLEAEKMHLIKSCDQAELKTMESGELYYFLGRSKRYLTKVDELRTNLDLYKKPTLKEDTRKKINEIKATNSAAAKAATKKIIGDTLNKLTDYYDEVEKVSAPLSKQIRKDWDQIYSGIRTEFAIGEILTQCGQIEDNVYIQEKLTAFKKQALDEITHTNILEAQIQACCDNYQDRCKELNRLTSGIFNEDIIKNISKQIIARFSAVEYTDQKNKEISSLIMKLQQLNL